jgi:uncharacterized protein (TIGR03435 family)
MRAKFWESLTVCAIASWCGSVAHAQTSQLVPYVPKLSYEVVSVHESKMGPNGLQTRFVSPPHEAKIDFVNLTLKNIVALAYNVRYEQLSGLPDWTNSTFYVVQARGDDAANESLKELSNADALKEKAHMLLLVLQDRFQLKTHIIQKELPVLKLVAAKGGTKLQPAIPEVAQGSDSDPRAASPLLQRCDQHGCELEARRVSMQHLASMLTGQEQAEVVDGTGLTGDYAFDLRWRPDSMRGGEDSPDAYPVLETALQEQLGLKFERTRKMTDVIVVDHIEKPTEN